MYAALVPFIGALITVMNLVNSRLSERVGYLPAALVVHVVGLAAVSALVLARREIPKPGRVPLLYYLGGMVGVGTVFSSNYAFACLDASLAVSLALLGQAFFSLFADSTGILGRTRYPLSMRRLPGIALAVAGAAVMAGRWRSEIPAILAALAAGATPGLTFILNSELGRRRGILKSVQWNYVTGLATTLVVLAVFRPSLVQAAQAALDAGPVLVLGGGLMGVTMVAAMNLIYPRIPAFTATLLLFSGQALTGVVIDYLVQGVLDARKLAGTCAVLAGLALNSVAQAGRVRAGKA